MEKLSNNILNEITKYDRFSRYYNTEDHNDFIDIDNYGIANTSTGKIIEKKTQGLIQIEGTTYVVVSNTEGGEPKLEVYSVDYQLPYIFELDKK